MIDFTDAPKFGREQGLKKALEHLHNVRQDDVVIVETGTTRGGLGGGIRGDGWATLAWGWYCKKYNGRLFTIDFLAEAIKNCKSITSDYATNIEYVVSDSVEYLKGFDDSIDLLYLDSNNDPNHTLNELKAVYKNIKNDGIILIDDTKMNSGKGELAIKYLESKGWEACYINGSKEPQVMFTRNKT
jgi:hypothetical protein